MDWRERLERLLHERKLDMRSVSRKAGMGDTYIRDAIRRGRGGSVDALRRIAKVLDVSVDWLMTGQGDSPKDTEDKGLVSPIAVPTQASDDLGDADLLRREVDALRAERDLWREQAQTLARILDRLASS